MVVTNIYDLLKTLNNVVEIANSESVTGKALLLADNDNGHAIERARVYIVETRKGVYRCNVWLGKKYQYIDDISKLISKKRSIDNNTECKYTRIAENELINVMKLLCDIQASRKTAIKKESEKTA
jgi:hypothetical protein